MGSALDATRTWVESLGELDPFCAVLAEAALRLAQDVDDPPETAQGGKASVAPYVNSLRATMTQLREAMDVDGEEDEGEWGEVVSLVGS